MINHHIINHIINHIYKPYIKLYHLWIASPFHPSRPPRPRNRTARHGLRAVAQAIHRQDAVALLHALLRRGRLRKTGGRGIFDWKLWWFMGNIWWKYPINGNLTTINGDFLWLKMVNNGMTMGYYPLVNIQKAIENGPVEIVDFPINSMVDLSIVMLNYQRVIIHGI